MNPMVAMMLLQGAVALKNSQSQKKTNIAMAEQEAMKTKMSPYTKNLQHGSLSDGMVNNPTLGNVSQGLAGGFAQGQAIEDAGLKRDAYKKYLNSESAGNPYASTSRPSNGRSPAVEGGINPDVLELIMQLQNKRGA